MLGYLPTDILFQRQTVFLELRSQKTVSFEEQIMSEDKIISKHIFKVKWRLLCLLSLKYFLQHVQFWKLRSIQSHDTFRPTMCKQKYLMDYRTLSSFQLRVIKPKVPIRLLSQSQTVVKLKPNLNNCLIKTLTCKPL